MKCTIILLFLGVLYQTSADRHEDMQKIGFVQHFLLEILDSIPRRSPSCDTEAIKAERLKTLHCLSEIKTNNSFCYTFTRHFENCAKILLEKVEDCADPVDKGLPTAAIASIVSQAEFLCTTDGEHILEIFNPCVFKSILEDPKRCLRSAQKEFIEAENPSVALPKVCRAACHLKNCFSGNFKEECKNEITLETVRNLYTASMKPCREKLEDKTCLSV